MWRRPRVRVHSSADSSSVFIQAARISQPPSKPDAKQGHEKRRGRAGVIAHVRAEGRSGDCRRATDVNTRFSVSVCRGLNETVESKSWLFASSCCPGNVVHGIEGSKRK